jgi:two-component system, NtrC family, response regulator GlrR
MIGKSQAFLNLLNLIQKISNSDVPVLIEGEAGTGKELAARTIHDGSKRKSGPFVALNGSDIPDAEFETELLGHFNAASAEAKDPQFMLDESAEGGTLFLDNVNALSSQAQAALLRFLQALQCHSFGGEGDCVPDVRLITACSADLSKLSAQGAFRQDLFYRLALMRLKMPTLRERQGDAILLADHFLKNCAVRYGTERRLDTVTSEWIGQYSWPGNVRELENLISREYLISGGSVIHIESPIEPKLERRKQMDRRTDNITELNFRQAKSRAIGEFERRYLEAILVTARGNVTRAANLVGKERRSLGKLLKKHGIDRHQYVALSDTAMPAKSVTVTRPLMSQSPVPLSGRMAMAGSPEVPRAPLLQE